jgi:hypothetical protein
MAMYCKKCYTNLEHAIEANRCPKCNRAFKSDSPKTYYSRPFPSHRRIVLNVVLTTGFGVLAAFVVAFHQAAGASGH